MAEFHGIHCCPFQPSVLLIERVGGMGSRVGGVGWGGVGGDKHSYLGHPISNHDAHTCSGQ